MIRKFEMTKRKKNRIPIRQNFENDGEYMKTNRKDVIFF